MDRNIKYVREKRIAPLLNDMVMHLLASTPSDPLNSLIAFLEKRVSTSPHTKTALGPAVAATVSSAPAAPIPPQDKKTSSSSPRNATGARDSTSASTLPEIGATSAEKLQNASDIITALESECAEVAAVARKAEDSEITSRVLATNAEMNLALKRFQSQPTTVTDEQLSTVDPQLRVQTILAAIAANESAALKVTEGLPLQEKIRIDRGIQLSHALLSTVSEYQSLRP